MQTAAYSASIILWIFLIFLLVSVISIAAMLISLAKRGDERRKEILSTQREKSWADIRELPIIPSASEKG